MILAKDDIIQRFVPIDANSLVTTGTSTNLNIVPAETMAIREDVLPLIGQELFDAMRDRSQSVYEADGTTVRQPGDYVYYDDVVYELLNATSSLPSPSNTDYLKSELMTFWLDKVVPVYCYSFTVHLVTRLGTNITRFNLSNQSGDRFTQASSSDRAVLIAQYQGLLRSQYNQVRHRLMQHGATFDTVSYTLPRIIKKYGYNIF